MIKDRAIICQFKCTISLIDALSHAHQCQSASKNEKKITTKNTQPSNMQLQSERNKLDGSVFDK